MSNGEDSDEGNEKVAAEALEMLKEQRQTEKFWEASVEREKHSGPTYMGDYHVHYSTFDGDRLENLIFISSTVITLVLILSTLLVRYTGFQIPIAIQVSGTIAVVTLIDKWWHRDGEETENDEGEN